MRIRGNIPFSKSASVLSGGFDPSSLADDSVIVIWGQSNSGGREANTNAPSGTAYDAALSAANTGGGTAYVVAGASGAHSIQTLEFGVNHYDPNESVDNSANYGWLCELALQFVQQHNKDVYFVLASEGDTSIKQGVGTQDWYPTSTGKSFDELTEKIDYALSNGASQVGGIFGCIGETDGADATRAADFNTNMQVLYTTLRILYGQSIPCFHFLMSSNLTASPYADYKSTINTAINDWAADQDHNHSINTDTVTMKADNVHYNAAGITEAASLAWTAWVNKTDAGTYSSLPGSAVVFTAASANVTINGNAINKTTSEAAGWDAGAVSDKSLTGDGSIIWRVVVDTHAIVGVSDNVSKATYSFTSIDHAIFIQNTEVVINSYQNGSATAIDAGSTSYRDYTWFKVERSGTTVKAFIGYDGFNWTEIHSFSTSNSNNLYLDISINQENEVLDNFRIVGTTVANGL